MSVLTKSSGLNKAVRQHYVSLIKGGKCQVTYVWLDITGEKLQCKTRTLDAEPTGLEDIPEWDTCWMRDNFTEVLLAPVRMFQDPFTLDPNKLVLCDVLVSDRTPTGAFRVGADNICAREISICHYNACLYAGVKISGINSEKLPSQWEFQVGPCEGIEMGDHLWMARYILHRVCEDFDVVASLDPKPVKGDGATSGCHANFSTKEMRSEGGRQHIDEAIRRLSRRHSRHLRVYDPHGGRDNVDRLVGGSSTSSFHVFSAAVARRDVSVRIPARVDLKGCGYLEDRRPAANCDPYAVTAALVETCLLGITAEDDGDSMAATAMKTGHPHVQP
ncbi:glutamine synthetase-like [Polymixia lowei]